MSSAHFEGRKKQAARLWSEYTDSQGPRQLDKWIAQRLKSEKKFGSQDRRFYSNAVFAAARYVHAFLFEAHCRKFHKLKSLSHFFELDRAGQRSALESFSADSSTEADSWSLIRAIPSLELLNFVLSQFTNEISAESELREFQKETENLFIKKSQESVELDSAMVSLLLVAYGIPAAWTEQLLQRAQRSSWNAETVVSFVRGQNERAPLWIRMNHVDKKSLVEHDLQSHGLKLSWESGSAAAVEGQFGLYQTASFKDGLFEIQDLASQQIAAAVRARPGEKIWDACAGGGGKSVALAADLRGKGALYASDVREYKLDEVKRRTLRAGFHNIRTMAWDATTHLKVGIEVERQSGFDAVLIDAPCSSSGTWRRNPDARLRVSTALARSELVELQCRILKQAALQVRPGGRIVYATCSWCVDENEQVVEAFEKQCGSSFSKTETLQQGQLLGHPKQNSDTMFVAVFDRSTEA